MVFDPATEEGAQLDALPLVGAALTDWLPDETLYSLVCRLHRIWGRALAGDTARILFGGQHCGTHHDFPSGLNHFARQTRELYGSSAQIAVSRTLLQYFLPFLSDEVKGFAISCMLGNTVAHLKFRLGLLTSRFRAHHPLKGCRDCLRADADRYQWPYWHLSHQFPGVWHCSRHGTELWVSPLKVANAQRFQWILPEDAALAPPDGSRAAGDGCTERSLSEFIHSAIATASPGSMRFEWVQEAMWAAANNRGWITKGGSLRTAPAADAFRDHCAKLRNFQEFSAFTPDAARDHLARLFRPIRSGTHPIRLLVGAHWLFETADKFAATLSDLRRGGGLPTCDVVPPMEPDSDRAHVVERLLAGHSMSSIGKEFALDFNAVAAIAAAEGLRVPRRPKRLHGPLLASVERELRRGDRVDEIASRYELCGMRGTTSCRRESTQPSKGIDRDRAAWPWTAGARRNDSCGPDHRGASILE